jgi:hypothetical protein
VLGEKEGLILEDQFRHHYNTHPIAIALDAEKANAVEWQEMPIRSW